MSESRTDTSLGKFKEWFRGAQCWEIQRLSSAVWWFRFGDAAAVNLACPWRILKGGKIALARDDDGQKFGLSKPIDTEAEALRLIGGNPATSVEIEDRTADLRIKFADGVELEAFNHSSGYEAWNAWVYKNSTTIDVIALGGGDIAVWQLPGKPYK